VSGRRCRRRGRGCVIDAGSVTSLSGPGLELLLDHLATAERAGREVPVRRSPVVEQVLAGRAGGVFSH
jgi:anti-anti-sigma regulatory factor